jgi:CubicO group peptidase (beta-lactamase class C family)
MRFIVWFAFAPLVVPSAALGASLQQAAVDAAVRAARADLNVPGIELAVWRNGKIEAVSVDGVRAQGSNDKVRPNDPFSIGSITKSLSSALAARLVEEGKLRWDSTIGEVLGKSISGLRPEYEDVTLEDLLCHQGGIVPQLERSALPSIMAQGSPAGRHLAAASAALSAPPSAQPRSQMIYSNPGYLVAAAMMEQAAGQSWEDLVRENVIEPLKLNSSGFGPPPSGVRGHMTAPDGSLTPLDPASPQADNPPFLTPAGRVSMNMADLARFAGDQLDGVSGTGALLKPATYQRIHTEHLRHAQLGWGGGPDGGFDNSGSNGRWLAYVRAIPAKHVVISVAINAVRHPEADEDRLAALAEQLAAQLPQ